ncbi:hypothetical protein ALNOE001_03640 [Candidatus Methanobinarius endosymbioticus]|uniref:Uncharacterized protein n=1 Tax=Candidatus Methanobinarius endosymbioticus TaxID=2006182 RepID=A0A366MDY9_9EURY|nr:hypothetical protein ALNOE001_03640 [Candidatus Methanobinarius endosymbioticus]
MGEEPKNERIEKANELRNKAIKDGKDLNENDFLSEKAFDEKYPEETVGYPEISTEDKNLDLKEKEIEEAKSESNAERSLEQLRNERIEKDNELRNKAIKEEENK